MLNQIILLLGLLALAIITFLFVGRLVRFLLIAYFGERVHITYIDRFGVKHKKTLNCKKDDELLHLLDELKKNARSKKKACH